MCSAINCRLSSFSVLDVCSFPDRSQPSQQSPRPACYKLWHLSEARGLATAVTLPCCDKALLGLTSGVGASQHSTTRLRDFALPLHVHAVRPNLPFPASSVRFCAIRRSFCCLTVWKGSTTVVGIHVLLVSQVHFQFLISDFRSIGFKMSDLSDIEHRNFEYQVMCHITMDVGCRRNFRALEFQTSDLLPTAKALPEGLRRGEFPSSSWRQAWVHGKCPLATCGVTGCTTHTLPERFAYWQGQPPAF